MQQQQSHNSNRHWRLSVCLSSSSSSSSSSSLCSSISGRLRIRRNPRFLSASLLDEGSGWEDARGLREIRWLLRAQIRISSMRDRGIIRFFRWTPLPPHASSSSCFCTMFPPSCFLLFLRLFVLGESARLGLFASFFVVFCFYLVLGTGAVEMLIGC